VDVRVDEPRDEVVAIGIDVSVAAGERRVGSHGDDDAIVGGDPTTARSLGSDDPCVSHDEVDSTR
jgi:hypothetical protein